MTSSATTAKGHAPKHADATGVRAALAHFTCLQLAVVTDAGHAEAIGYGYLAEPAGNGAVAVYWVSGQRIRHADGRPFTTQLYTARQRLESAGWTVADGEDCLIATAPEADQEAAEETPAAPASDLTPEQAAALATLKAGDGWAKQGEGTVTRAAFAGLAAAGLAVWEFNSATWWSGRLADAPAVRLTEPQARALRIMRAGNGWISKADGTVTKAALKGLVRAGLAVFTSDSPAFWGGRLLAASPVWPGTLADPVTEFADAMAEADAAEAPADSTPKERPTMTDAMNRYLGREAPAPRGATYAAADRPSVVRAVIDGVAARAEGEPAADEQAEAEPPAAVLRAAAVKAHPAAARFELHRATGGKLLGCTFQVGRLHAARYGWVTAAGTVSRSLEPSRSEARAMLPAQADDDRRTAERKAARAAAAEAALPLEQARETARRSHPSARDFHPCKTPAGQLLAYTFKTGNGYRCEYGWVNANGTLAPVTEAYRDTIEQLLLDDAERKARPALPKRIRDPKREALQNAALRQLLTRVRLAAANGGMEEVREALAAYDRELGPRR